MWGNTRCWMLKCGAVLKAYIWLCPGTSSVMFLESLSILTLSTSYAVLSETPAAHFYLETLSFLSKAPSKKSSQGTVSSKRLTPPGSSGPGHASIYINPLQTPSHSCSECAPGYHAWSTEDLLVSPPLPHPLHLTGRLFLRCCSHYAPSLPFGGVSNISQTRCWTVLVIPVVGLNPQWDKFQVDLKSVTRVKLNVFSLSQIPQRKPPWNRNHMCTFLHQNLILLTERSSKRKNGSTDCSRWRQWMHTDPVSWFLSSVWICRGRRQTGQR